MHVHMHHMQHKCEIMLVRQEKMTCLWKSTLTWSLGFLLKNKLVHVPLSNSLTHEREEHKTKMFKTLTTTLLAATRQIAGIRIKLLRRWKKPTHTKKTYNSTKVLVWFRHIYTIGDFRVAFRLCFKASPSAKPFIWKLVLFTCKWTKICIWIKLISTWKALH